MKIKLVVIIALVLGLVGGLVYYQTDWFKSDEQIYQAKIKKQVKKLDRNENYNALYHFKSIDEIDQKIKNGDEFLVMYGWARQCGDALNFEVNAFDEYYDKYDVVKDMQIADLDVLLPEGLNDKTKRKPVADRLLLSSWQQDKSVEHMTLYSPQLVYYKDGKIYDLVTWTPKNGDSTYGIQKTLLDEFFNNISK